MAWHEIKCSVRDIVDFIYASGDLLPTYTTFSQMQEGTRIHQHIQSQWQDYLSEVFVKAEGDYLGFHYDIQGRIDLFDPDGTELIEIKSSLLVEDEDLITKYPNHLAQAKFYGYMLYEMGKKDRKEPIAVTVLYVHKHSLKTIKVTDTYTYSTLQSFFFDTLRQYIEFQRMILRFKEQKMESIQKMAFPFPSCRNGQDQLIQAVQEKIELRENLFVNAPTGIGKSLGTIYPSLKALSNIQEQIFYLTAKSTVKLVADDTVELLRHRSGLICKSLVLTAKEKICLNDELKCHPKDCPFARDFYKRLRSAVFDIFKREDRWDEMTIKTYALKHGICPFEYQLTLSLFADILIGDYNYAFDPRVYLKHFFDAESPKLILLIDEAHNLYDRVTDMYTVGLSPDLIKRVVALSDFQHGIEKHANRLMHILERYHQVCLKEQKEYLSLSDLDTGLLDEVKELLNRLETYFEALQKEEETIPEELLDAYYQLHHFVRISDYFSEDFIVWIECTPASIHYQLSCLNPKEIIRSRTRSVLSTIFFSATLHPIEYYQYLYGGMDTDHLYIESPYDPTQLDLIVNADVSTKYRDRPFTKEAVAESIREIVQKPGKYLVFFPSYEYLKLVEPVIRQLIDGQGIELIVQTQGMDDRMRVQFIEQFDTSVKHIVGLAVLGGAFAEGIDLVGDRLNGVVVVGVGLPTFSPFRKELSAYFFRQGLNGYHYAFTYPGFNKVLQAVGRVIRSEQDYGVALLIDTRYKNPEYLALFPLHWSHFRWYQR